MTTTITTITFRDLIVYVFVRFSITP